MLGGESVTVSDSETRRAARLATLVALPIAVVAGLLAFLALRPSTPPKGNEPASAQPTTAVSMAAPKLSEADAVICRAFAAGLPSKLRDLAQRPVTAGSEQNAAYGEPPITVACGAPLPKVNATDLVLPMNNVCWYPSTSGSGKETTFTTLDRQVPIAVTIPSSYDQPAQWANEFSDDVLASVKSVKSPYC
jgi:hypothetical protein